MSKIPEKLLEFIRNLATESNYIIVDVFLRGGRTASIDVILDKDGGITLDECSNFNRDVTVWIDEEGMFTSGYTLDVCSPGLDRVLKSDNEFLWACGKEVIVKTFEPVEEKKEFIGKLLQVDNPSTILIKTTSGKDIKIERKNIAKAKLHVAI